MIQFSASTFQPRNACPSLCENQTAIVEVCYWNRTPFVTVYVRHSCLPHLHVQFPLHLANRYSGDKAGSGRAMMTQTTTMTTMTMALPLLLLIQSRRNRPTRNRLSMTGIIRAKSPLALAQAMLVLLPAESLQVLLS